LGGERAYRGRVGKGDLCNSRHSIASEFTSQAFTGALERAGVGISMDGRGRFLDNIFIERLWALDDWRHRIEKEKERPSFLLRSRFLWSSQRGPPQNNDRHPR
jgi:transposase InsO family protein